MLRLYLFIIVVSLSHELTLCAENKTQEQVYYKRTENVAPETNKSITTDGKIAMEISSPALVKKATTKIKPRKGVSDKLEDNIHQNETLLPDNLAEKPVEEKTDETAVDSESKRPIVTVKLLSTTTQKSTTLHAAPANEKLDANVTRVNTTTTVKKFNPKPTVTYAEEEAEDESMPHFPTSKTLLGMPRKIDYIVPVIITITALPLLGAAFYVLYKRGRDYWDKRHYRRMDFLIDGMYNE